MSSSRQNGGRAGSHRTRAAKGRRTSQPSPWEVMVRIYNQEESAALEADWDGGIRASVGRTFDRYIRTRVFKPSEFDQISQWLQTQARGLPGMHRHLKTRKIHRRDAEQGKRRATVKSPVRKATGVSASTRPLAGSLSKPTSHSRFTGAPSKHSQRGAHR
jgi:hypothetical protein